MIISKEDFITEMAKRNGVTKKASREYLNLVLKTFFELSKAVVEEFTRYAYFFTLVEGLIAQNIEPIRPGRSFARQHRFKLPMSFCYRN